MGRKLIYLDDAIEAIEELDWYHQNCNNEMVSGANSSEHQAWYKADDVYEALEKLPAVQSERKKGEWIDYTDDGYVECPFCHSATTCDDNKDELHFCFSCGADMRGEEE